MSYEKLLALACVLAAMVVLVAMYEREKHWQQRANSVVHQRKEDALWPTRHAARWLCVATLLVTALQHWRTDYAWWPALTSALKFLPDVLLALFGVVYGASVFCPRWLAAYVARKTKKT